MPGPTLPIFAFPFVENYDVRESSFFQGGKVLPAPEQVRLMACGQYRGGHFSRPPVVRYGDLGLLVKYGHHVSIAEAHCLLFLKEHAPTVPVPELYGWRRDKRQTFIYMELINGRPSRGSYASSGILKNIQTFVNVLKAIPQTLVSPVPFVGHVNGTHLRDWFIQNSPTPDDEAGPFPSVAEFHDWLANGIGKPASSKVLPEKHAEFRSDLLDDSPIVLSHGGLTLDNVLVSQQVDGTEVIVAIVDWSQAGWYPSYWDRLKMPFDGVEKGSEEVLRCVEACNVCIMNAGA